MSLYRVSNPLGDALAVITGVVPPIDLTGITSPDALCDTDMLELLNWCSYHARPEWATGESIYDAAWLLVERAIENDNI